MALDMVKEGTLWLERY